MTRADVLRAERVQRRATTLAIRARKAAALDPAMIDAAERVCAALNARGLPASQGTGANALVVTARQVSAEDKPRVDGISLKAASPYWGDCVAFQSYINVTVKTGRAIELERRYIERKGDDGDLTVVRDDDTSYHLGERQGHPLANVHGSYE